MPTYVWSCDACEKIWDVVTTVADRDTPSPCPVCAKTGERQITLPQIDKTSAGSWNQQEYNPGLGCWTKSWKHGRQIAKARGLEEVGTESPQKISERAEKQREEAARTRYDDCLREKVYD